MTQAEWNAYVADGNARQARKRVAADVLLRDETGHILLVDPNYKPNWDLPGHGRSERASLVSAPRGPRRRAEYLGHANPGFTLRTYIHMLPDSHERAIRAIDVRLFRPRSVA